MWFRLRAGQHKALHLEPHCKQLLLFEDHLVGWSVLGERSPDAATATIGSAVMMGKWRPTEDQIWTGGLSAAAICGWTFVAAVAGS